MVGIQGSSLSPVIFHRSEPHSWGAGGRVGVLRSQGCRPWWGHRERETSQRRQEKQSLPEQLALSQACAGMERKPSCVAYSLQSSLDSHYWVPQLPEDGTGSRGMASHCRGSSAEEGKVVACCRSRCQGLGQSPDPLLPGPCLLASVSTACHITARRGWGDAVFQD